ncbi:hypothetical protein O181_077177 [Austropuccinia psidii MF-1]|uniref:Uncharacterized protein n=1 Tax=Austropuccinia psidii MF-1 TaxID=1389203 RepID=A0A9Q3IEG2_9BASI|nr:hypothetical protein [Austropuccinia psidii MF-1]
MTNQIQLSPTKKLDRLRESHSYAFTPERLVHMKYGQNNSHNYSIVGRNWNNESGNLTQSNDFPKASERDENLESKQIFHTIRREINLNQRKSGIKKIHREVLAYGRAQFDSETPRHGGRNSIFPTTVQQLKDLKANRKFFHNYAVIPGRFQQRTWKPNGRQYFFQKGEEIIRSFNEISPRGTQSQKFNVPTNSVASSEYIDPQLMPIYDKIPPQNFETNDSRGSGFIWSNMGKFMEWTYDHVKEKVELNTRGKTDYEEGLKECPAEAGFPWKEDNYLYEKEQQEDQLFPQTNQCFKPITKFKIVKEEEESEDEFSAYQDPRLRCDFTYQYGKKLSCSEKKTLKQLPEMVNWPKFSGIGEYDHMELIYHIDGIFLDFPKIPDYWITTRLNN